MGELAGARTAGPSLLRLGLTLGLLSVLGPISIDLYLPAFPTIARDLAASPSDVQRTLSIFFLALALAQIPIGAFGDRYGRKPILLIGLALFVGASIACALAADIGSLLALRFVQGLGVCAGTAVSRAIIRDLRTGHEAARLMAVSFLIIGLSPIIAPLLGSLLLTLLSWRGLFLLLAGLGVASLALVHFALSESLPRERRVHAGTPILPGIVGPLRDARFVGGAVVAGLATTIPFAYVTAAPFVYTGIFGLDARTYSLLLALNAVCSIGSTQLSPGLMRRWGPRNVLVRISLAGALLTGIAGLLLVSGQLNLILFQGYSMLLFALAGLLLTPAAISAMDSGKGGAGAAAGMLGALQLVVVAIASAAVSVFPTFSLAPLIGVLGSALLLAWLLSLTRAAAD
ncbi:Bcr/CflA family efflux MFS transporter [Sphingomonas sp. ZT3P38]|uniref:Bcr/CflA family efflux MFS transporter n=1 Tax=Parasphingomonas zepuensis TaxID=3096161 RepID=UPI002FCA160D